MDKTLPALVGILLSGLPTFFLVLILTICVKVLYVNPLKKVLAERHRLTEGAKKAAEESLSTAESKVAEYEAALKQAREEIYREQAEFLLGVHAEQQAHAKTAREDAEKRVAAAKAMLAGEAQAARLSLEAQSEALAGEIADSILTRRVA